MGAVANATPFLMLMGQVGGHGCSSGRRAWQRKSSQLRAAGHDELFLGKIATARYFVEHVLPEADAAARAIKGGDLCHDGDHQRVLA